MSTMAKQIIDNNKFTGVRLPTGVKPTHYDISLKPNFEKFTFDGKVKIDYVSLGDSKPENIVLHANDIVINDGTLQAGSTSGALKTVTYSQKSETATLEFEHGIAPSGTLTLNFTGILNDKMRGFYKTTYKIEGTQVFAATTRFEVGVLVYYDTQLC